MKLPHLTSLTVHLGLLLLCWQVFRLAARPEPFGYVISCEIDEGEGADSELLTMFDSPIPKTEEQAAPDAVTVDAARIADGAAVPAVDVGSRAGAGGTAGGGKEAGSGIGFFGSPVSANSAVFVVDKSGSMNTGIRIMTAKQELKNALTQLQPHQRFYVIFYDDHMYPMLDPDAPDDLLPATREHVDEVLEWMESDVTAGGDNDPTRSLITALNLAPEVIYFLTDGDVKPSVPATILRENRHHTTIHTLCFSDDYGEQVMQQIAQENWGRYRFVDSPREDRPRKRRPSRDDRAATAMLRNARKYLRNGQESTGVRWLRKLIAEHPGTPPAQQAQQLLDARSAP